jgi:hypothetical protein
MRGDGSPRTADCALHDDCPDLFFCPHTPIRGSFTKPEFLILNQKPQSFDVWDSGPISVDAGAGGVALALPCAVSATRRA